MRLKYCNYNMSFLTESDVDQIKLKTMNNILRTVG